MTLANPKRFVRFVLLSLSASIFAISLVLSLGFFAGLMREGQADPVAFEANVATAIEARIALSASFFQASLLLLASIWSVAILNKKEASVILEQPPELLMMAFANGAILVSFCAHFAFAWQMSSILFHAVQWNRLVPEIDEFDVTYAFSAQLVSLIGAALIVAFTVFSGRWLKPELTSTADSVADRRSSQAAASRTDGPRAPRGTDVESPSAVDQGQPSLSSEKADDGISMVNCRPNETSSDVTQKQ